MRRLVNVLLGVAMSLAALAGTASADIEWCAEDPVFNIRGTVFRLTTSIQSDASQVTGITYDVTLPAEAEGVTTIAYPQGRRLPTTLNVNYLGTSSSGGYAVTVAVTVTGPAGTAVRVDLAGPSVTPWSGSGSTGTAIVASFTASR